MRGPELAAAVTIVTRMDYLAQFFNEQAYSLAVDRLLEIDVPPRGATYAR